MSGEVGAATLVVLGDSISAGYGLEKIDQGWVSLLAEKLRPRGMIVVNASISGDTSAGGLSRIDALLAQHHPAVLILELGGNDGLRGLPPGQMAANLGGIIDRAGAAGVQVLLLGMKIPPNYGKRYTEMFQKVYTDLAGRDGVALVPFLLDGVGGVEVYMQADGIHPNREAQPLLLEQVWNKLELLLAGKPR
ncbi:acyl-CoA thioesterase-1 [Methylomagnum ishizawai]|uniref:Acyl-CoA thioesterase-1 n=2 Tax=Methylomagnum ishizawai TaxID=1760988 RepID=A0A1Y6CXC7_9GAMM|nr:acyl-CoA thioesterase-1 [Methylomagnum ishizawai]